MISARISKAHGFANCVGLSDGTLFPLVFEPMLNRKIISQGKLIMHLKV